MTATLLFREMDVHWWLEHAGEELKALGHLIIVAHDNPELYEFLRQKFAPDPDVRVVLDRRRDARRPDGATAAERRRTARRQAADRLLRDRGFVVIPDSDTDGGRAEPDAAPPSQA